MDAEQAPPPPTDPGRRGRPRRKRAGNDAPAAPRASRAEAAHQLKSLAKVADILDCFSLTARELAVSEIARRTGMPKSTAHRIIDSMRACGFLEQDATRERYRLGMKLFEYGSTVLSSMDLQRIAGPFIAALTRRSGEGGHLCVFNGTHMVLVRRVMRDAGSPNTFTEMEESACHATGVGKATLAFQPAPVLQRIIDGGLPAFTRNTITDPARLEQALAAIRARGFAIDDGEHDAQVRCVAAPIRNASGRVFAAISLTGPARPGA